jgi:alkylation response protein AidB-like acyl-CoA dehydrogenase
MQIYKAPIQDMLFLLGAFGYAEKVQSLDKYASYDLEMVEALLRQAGSFASDVMLAVNRSGDEEGLKWDPKTGDVTTPKGFIECYAQMVENGFNGIVGPEDFGGAGAPLTLGNFMNELWTASNKSLSMCPGLTAGLVEALEQHASDELKQAYLPKLVPGEWSGTMCLTEPQCGTDLGLVRTKAVPFEDHHKLTGTKIWITFGEHDLTENIVHLVLARLPDAPPGIKGISSFLVPKITLDVHASPTCVIDMEDAEGWLVGEPHKGMRAMFTMMNGARLMVGNEGVALAEIAYQTALEFAKDRKQSRSLDPAKRDKDGEADNILVHPDVRRMLLNIKSTTEGLRGLATFIGGLIDVAHAHPSEDVRQEADDMVQLLTPVMKGFGTERGFDNVSEAMQVCGGAGYTTDWSIEQYLRDVRIGMIYEGTNHIQALDLVGRKLPRHGGRLLQVYAKRVTDFIGQHKEVEGMAEFVAPLGEAFGQLTAATMELGGKAMADPEEAGAAASNYLTLFGLNAVAYCWAVQCAHALKTPGVYSDAKLKTARYYFSYVLPERHGLVEIIKAGKAAMMDHTVDEL